MNNEFIQYLTKTIILSFGVPSTVIDQLDQIELAKTLSMSNLDIARCVLDAQVELLPSLTKLLRTIVAYEMPDFVALDDLEASLTPPTAIILEMNKEMTDAITDMAQSLADLLIAAEGETPSDKRKRLFKLRYFKMNAPSLDWDKIENIVTAILIDAKEEEQKAALEQSNSTPDGSDDMNPQGGL